MSHFADDETIAELERLQKENQRLIMTLADTEALELGTSERCEKLQEELAAAHLAIEQMRKLLEGWLGLSQNSSIESGVCCCGESMEKHSHPMAAGHSPCDSGTYYAEKLICDTESCIALQPSTEALREFLRKHDAALLRSLKFPTLLRKMWSGGEVANWINDRAKSRESGEWEPTLEVK